MFGSLQKSSSGYSSPLASEKGVKEAWCRFNLFHWGRWVYYNLIRTWFKRSANKWTSVICTDGRARASRSLTPVVYFGQKWYWHSQSNYRSVYIHRVSSRRQYLPSLSSWMQIWMCRRDGFRLYIADGCLSGDIQRMQKCAIRKWPAGPLSARLPSKILCEGGYH